MTLTSDGFLRFEIIRPLAPGQTLDEAAQSVWTAFDIAFVLLNEDECTFFEQVEVTVVAQGSQARAEINAHVSLADLLALYSGDLNEDEFIERVDFRVTKQD